MDTLGWPLIEKLLAGAVLAACGVLLLGMLLGSSRRERLKAWLRRARRWRRSRAVARREAEQAIQRARGGRNNVQKDGNVYRPRSFNDRTNDDTND